ncbi:tetratricopeptide repeat protein [Desulfogranum mediterraneum]|uniref:tetratricopeptide repeat protein n=1 Tax=Desulfogranum mediterraneum TaxID=160661 RepID=UPI000417AC13|nr:tetratricopeptide repeat protein [Desulfogranum mediterraneum]
MRLLCLSLCFCLLAGCLFSPLSQARELNPDERIIRYKVDAYRYYTGKGKPRNYGRAFRLYRQAALLGDPEAQFIVGGMLYRGQGTDPDQQQAFTWLLKAAKQGKSSPESMAIIGGMFLRGSGVPQNYSEARRWLEPAARAGRLEAINDLAYILYHGLAGEQDMAGALALYTKAAMQKDPLAQANVGMMYATGTGTGVDRARGYAWYSLAASQGNTMAVIQRNNLMVEMSWEELNHAQAISLQLFQQIEQFDGGDGVSIGPAE